MCEVTIAVLSNTAQWSTKYYYLTAPGLVLPTCPHCTLCSCRADGRLLQLTQPLAVTAAQLARMAARCPARTPHSCAGEIWSGHTRLPAVRDGPLELVRDIW